MANPQKDNGWDPIPRALTDDGHVSYSLRETKVLLYAIHETHGFRRDSAPLDPEYLAEQLAMWPKDVRATLAKLEERGLLEECEVDGQVEWRILIPLEGGWWPLAVELLKVLVYAPLRYHVLLVVFWVVRKTFGEKHGARRKTQAELSAGFLADLIGLHRNRVQAALAEARDLGILICVHPGRRGVGSVWKLNKDYEQWAVWTAERNPQDVLAKKRKRGKTGASSEGKSGVGARRNRCGIGSKSGAHAQGESGAHEKTPCTLRTHGRTLVQPTHPCTSTEQTIRPASAGQSLTPANAGWSAPALAGSGTARPDDAGQGTLAHASLVTAAHAAFEARPADAGQGQPADAGWISKGQPSPDAEAGGRELFAHVLSYESNPSEMRATSGGAFSAGAEGFSKTSSDAWASHCRTAARSIRNRCELLAYQVATPAELAELVLGWMSWGWAWTDVEAYADKTREHVVETAERWGMRVALVGARECLTQIAWEHENNAASFPASLVIPHTDKVTGVVKDSKLELACRQAHARFEQSDRLVADGRKPLDSHRWKEPAARRVRGEEVRWQRPRLFPVVGAWWFDTAFDDRRSLVAPVAEPSPVAETAELATLALETLPAAAQAAYRRWARQQRHACPVKAYQTDDGHPVLLAKMRELLSEDLATLALEGVALLWRPVAAGRLATWGTGAPRAQLQPVRLSLGPMITAGPSSAATRWSSLRGAGEAASAGGGEANHA